MNNKVPRPIARRSRAASKTLRSSATPENTADRGTNSKSEAVAKRRAMVVLPQPGGPHRIIDANCLWASIRPSGASGANRWSWPTTSVNVPDRKRSAKGRGASCSNRDIALPLELAGQHLAVAADGDHPTGRSTAKDPLHIADPGDFSVIDGDQ